MAEVLKTYTFAHAGPHQKYPWAMWLDGQIWKLTKGVDFSVATASLRATAKTQASRQGIIVRTEIPDENTLILQTIARATPA